MITLDPTSWEYAAKMKNFSGWVREQLKKQAESEGESERDRKEKNPLYEVYCMKCTEKFFHLDEFIAQNHFCMWCGTKTSFLGLVE